MPDSTSRETVMNWTRSSGILLHPTSLPGHYGIGDLGKAAYRWIDWLASSKQKLWQVLPLGPTGFADSPYACFSAFAGNPLLISLETLVQAEDLSATDLAGVPAFPQHEVDYGAVIAYKTPLLDKAAQHFLAHATAERRAAYETFDAENAYWLDDYALFMALKERFNLAIWYDWETGIALRRPEAMARWKKEVAERIAVHKVLQFWFNVQWQEVKAYANARDIQIIGDVPIFVAPDSADVWANRDLFHLDPNGHPTLVSGVPPDYFSETGQRWGNPLYRWDVIAEREYAWWIARTRATLQIVDIVRIDHFRGFVGYWEIPASEPTAVRGRWVPGPGAALFEALQGALGELPIMAEDLGVITPEVIELRERFGIPGMKILQFAFDEDALRASFGEPGTFGKQGAQAETQWRNPFLPHNYTRTFVAYSGSHDNETALGWFQNATPAQQKKALAYLHCAPEDFNWALIRAALSSVADMAIIPLQDILGLGNEARMNHPGTVGSNWRWRYTPGALTDPLANRLASLVERYER
jgi:4-alpha-glucanotransferase